MDPPIDLDETPALSWRWRVLTAFDNRDETSKPGDDFAARVSVLLRRPPGSRGLLGRIRRRALQLVYGADMPDRALHFVWTSQAPVGTRWPSPYTPKDAWSLAVSNGPASPEWRQVRVDVAAESRRAFPGEALRPVGVAIMTDSDNRCAQASAEYGVPAWGS